MMQVSNSSVRNSYTVSEILSQPETWRQCLGELQRDGIVEKIHHQTKPHTERMFVGCGTSFYLAEAAAASWTLLTGEPARAMPCSEIILFPKTAQLSEYGDDQRTTAKL